MEHAVSPPAAPRAIHVLLVDDDVFLLELMVELLGSIGVTAVQVAHSGMEGLARYRTSNPRPNVVVCDLCMPGLDGMEFLRHLAKERCQADIVIVSGHNLTPPNDPHWGLAKYDGPVLHLAEKMARLQGLRVRATFEKPITRDKVLAMMARVGYQANATVGATTG